MIDSIFCLPEQEEPPPVTGTLLWVARIEDEAGQDLSPNGLYWRAHWRARCHLGKSLLGVSARLCLFALRRMGSPSAFLSCSLGPISQFADQPRLNSKPNAISAPVSNLPLTRTECPSCDGIPSMRTMAGMLAHMANAPRSCPR
jgi:hypothetical protein